MRGSGGRVAIIGGGDCHPSFFVIDWLGMEK